jgi:hypothetical protein
VLLCQPGQYQLRFGAAPLEFDDGCLSMPPPEKVISIVGMGLAAVLFVPAIATAWTAWQNSTSRCRQLRCPCRSRAWVRLRSTCSVPFVSRGSEPMGEA